MNKYILNRPVVLHVFFFIKVSSANYEYFHIIFDPITFYIFVYQNLILIIITIVFIK